MPELPEVEIVRRTLGPLVGRRIEAVRVRCDGVIRGLSTEAFSAHLIGHRVRSLDRRGKYLIIGLAPKTTLLVHLRMTGRLTLAETGAPISAHTHVQMALSGGGELRYEDQRRFGGFWVLGEGTAPPGLATLGPEPLSDDWDRARFLRQLRHRSGPIKAALLDQRLVAGVGNIYADESLFAAGLHPGTPAQSLSEEQVGRLFVAVRDTLRHALEHHGTTISDFLDGTGEPGQNAQELKVYGRRGLPCEGCGAPIEKTRLAGRGTHFCPTCQRPAASAKER